MDLTSLSQTARKGIILLGVGIVALILIYIAYGLVVNLVKSLRPAPPPVANNLFGTLSPIKFENPVNNTAKYTFSLETVDAQLPATPLLFKVYQLKQPPSLFQGLEQAKKRAAEFRFNTEPVSLSSSLYQFRDPDLLGYSFSLDVITGDYHLLLDPSQRIDLLSGRVNLDNTGAIKQARDYLSSHASMTTAFENGIAEVKFLNITPKQTTTVSSGDQANSFRVDFFPSPIEENYPVMSQKSDEAPINITMLADNKGDESIFEINYKQFEIDSENPGTYDIKDSSTAWNELKEGGGTVLKSSKTSGPIAINNISLGYFLENGSKYLKPIYIFSGTSSVDQLKADFIAVLPAIAVENETQ